MTEKISLPRDDLWKFDRVYEEVVEGHSIKMVVPYAHAQDEIEKAVESVYVCLRDLLLKESGVDPNRYFELIAFAKDHPDKVRKSTPLGKDVWKYYEMDWNLWYKAREIVAEQASLQDTCRDER